MVSSFEFERLIFLLITLHQPSRQILYSIALKIQLIIFLKKCSGRFTKVVQSFVDILCLSSSLIVKLSAILEMSIDLDLAKRLEGNSKAAYINGFTIFLKLLNNIIDNPQEEKYRKFKKTNPRISGELLSLDGMEQLILESGFELDKDEFVIRRGGVGMISKLKNYRDFFQKRLEMMKQNSSTLTTSAVPSSSSSGAIQKTVTKPRLEPVKILANKPFHDRIKFPQILQTNNKFLRDIEQLSDSVMQYEDELLQKSALQLIPTERFRLNAIEKLRKIQKLIKAQEITEDEPPLQDLVLEELAEWFKNDFFTWINAMPCKRCKNPGTDAVGTRSENGVRIEVSHCET